MTDPTFKDRAGLEAEARIEALEASSSHWLGEAQRLLKSGQDALERIEVLESLLGPDFAPLTNAALRSRVEALEAELTRLRAENEALRGMLLATGEAAATHLKRAMKAEESK